MFPSWLRLPQNYSLLLCFFTNFRARIELMIRTTRSTWISERYTSNSSCCHSDWSEFRAISDLFFLSLWLPQLSAVCFHEFICCCQMFICSHEFPQPASRTSQSSKKISHELSSTVKLRLPQTEKLRTPPNFHTLKWEHERGIYIVFHLNLGADLL